MATVNTIGNNTMSVPQADVIRSTQDGSEVISTNNTVLVNVITPISNSIPHYDANLNYVPITYDDLIDDFLSEPEAITQIGIAAKAAVAFTIYKVSKFTATNTVQIDPASAAIFDITLTVANALVVLAALTDDTGYGRQITLKLRQGTGSNKVVWPNNINWSENVEPILSFAPNRADIITLFTMDSGVTWDGYYSTGWLPNA